MKRHYTIGTVILVLATAIAAVAFIQIDDTHVQTVLVGAIKTFQDAIRFQETGGGTEYVGVVAPAVVNTPSVTYKLPKNDGSTGQALVTDGSANTSWATIGGGGLNTCGTQLSQDVTYWTDAATICGHTNFTFDYTNFSILGQNLTNSNDGTRHMFSLSGSTQRFNTGAQDSVKTSISMEGNEAFDINAFRVNLQDGVTGYGGSNSIRAGIFNNTGTSGGDNFEFLAAAEPIGTFGVHGETNNDLGTAGLNVGVFGRAHANSNAIGVYGKSDAQNNSGENIGVLGTASHGADSNTGQVIGVAGVMGTLVLPSAPGAAVLGDNGTYSMDSFTGMDNGKLSFRVEHSVTGTTDNGVAIIPAATSTAPLISSFNQAGITGDVNLSLGCQGDCVVSTQSPVVPPQYGAGTLPTCNSSRKGALATATDCNAPCTQGGTCSGSGSTVCPMYCDGSAWKEH